MSRYPLTVPWTLLGFVLGALVAVGTDDLLQGYTVFTLLTAVALTWRTGDPPVFPFIAAYQWTSITVGYWYYRWFGVFPGVYPPADVERTVMLSLTGLLVLALGIRFGYEGLLWLLGRLGRPVTADTEVETVRNLKALFIVVMCAYGIDYLYVINTKSFGGLDSILQRLVDLRQVLLVVLWFEVLRRRRGFVYLGISLVWTFVPRLGSYYSDFKSPLILMLIVLASTWRPWDAKWWPKSLWAAFKGSPILAALLLLLLIWQGGIKKETREAYAQGFIGNDPLQRITSFVDHAQDALPVLFDDPQPFVETLVERISYITFFSRVLEHVPAREAHAEGELLGMAVSNLMPRFIFPEKPPLPSDSYYTRRFAGVQVAETNTSVSIGYMAEFYADWGLTGMFAAILGYGLLIGVGAGVVRSLAPVPAVRVGVMTVVFLAVADFEHQFIKGLAALVMSVAMTTLLLFVLRPLLLRLLDVGRPEEMPQPGPVGSVRTSMV